MHRGLSLACVAVLLGCSGSDPKPAPPAKPSPPAAPVAEAKAVEQLAQPNVELQARRLVDAWLAAQNSGDFAAYGALYAERFQGIRRTGDKAVRLPGKQLWLADRARMFERAMTVSIADLHARRDKEAISASFVQTWRSGRYEDEGPKAISWLRDAASGQWLIIREEMLASRPSSAPSALASSAYRRVRSIEPQSLWIELGPPTREYERKGSVSYRAIAPAHYVWAAVARDDSSDDFEAWARKRVRLVNLDGHMCFGETVGDGYAVAKLEDRWAEGLDESSALYDAIAGGIERASQPDLAELERGFDASEHALYTPVTPGPECVGFPWFAQLAELPAPRFATPFSDATLEEAARRAFNALPSVRRGIEWMREDEPDYGREPIGNVDLFAVEGDDEVFAVVRAYDDCPCWSCTVSAAVLFSAKRGAVSPRLAKLSESSEQLDVLAIVDIDADGRFETIQSVGTFSGIDEEHVRRLDGGSR